MTKVYKLIVMVVDHDDVGHGGVVSAIEDANYPNDCISPKVMESYTAKVEWDDDHPLNKKTTMHQEFDRLFPQ